MEGINKNAILENNINHIKAIRKTHSLDQPGRVEEAVQALEQWIKVQRHFRKKDLPYQYLEATIISSKGETEKAKKKLELIFSLRTKMPEYFGDFDIRKDFKELYGKIQFAILPKLTKDLTRIIIVRNAGKSYRSDLLPQFTRIMIMVLDYLKMYDYSDGFVLICDMTEASLMEIIKKISLEYIRHAASILVGIYGTRIKGIHLLSSSRLMNIIIWFIKQAAPAKIMGRIHAHETIKPVYNFVSSDLLPEDYGGNESTLEILHEKWQQALESEQFREFQQEMKQAVICEEIDSNTEDSVCESLTNSV